MREAANHFADQALTAERLLQLLLLEVGRNREQESPRVEMASTIVANAASASLRTSSAWVCPCNTADSVGRSNAMSFMAISVACSERKVSERTD